jgi:hypothetical protein
MQAIDLTRIRTIPLEARSNKVSVEVFAEPARKGRTFADFLDSIPHFLAGNDLRDVVRAIATARLNRRPVVVGMGAHVIKCGLSRIIVDLMERGIITALATNGAGAIHDFEIALIGETSEDVAAGLQGGTFGMVRETGELMHRGINEVLQQSEAGMGALLGDILTELHPRFQQYSLLTAARRLGIPFTVHVTIGADILHMHPTANGAALGQSTFNDFRLFAAVVSGLSGGVYLNIGSATTMPEVFLKAFTVAQNLGARLHDFVTVNLDAIAHYRPGENVVRRPSLAGGRGYQLLGRHEIIIPLLAQAVVEELG